MEDNTSPKPVKRRLRQAPETVRERNQRIGNQQEVQQQKRDSRGSGKTAAFWYGFSLPLRKLGRAITSLKRFKFFRVLGNILYPAYFRNSWKELRQVSWPDRKTSWKLTYAVIVFSVIFGIIVFVVDFALDKLFKELILK